MYTYILYEPLILLKHPIDTNSIPKCLEWIISIG